MPVQILKPSGAQLIALQAASVALRQANAVLAKAKESADAAKEAIINWLKSERSIDIETLPIGEIVMIEDVVIIKITSQNRFDEKAFLLADPAIHAKWKKDMPVRKFDPLA
jgi:hypothetical protein